MFTYAEEIEPDLIGEHAFGDDMAKHLRLWQRTALLVDGDVSKRVETQFNRVRHVPPLSSYLPMIVDFHGDARHHGARRISNDAGDGRCANAAGQTARRTERIIRDVRIPLPSVEKKLGNVRCADAGVQFQVPALG